MQKKEVDIVPYKTVEQYREYMSGSPDDDKTQRHNPPPDDGMTLAELGHKRDDEILQILNEMGQCENKSDIRVMYCHGYSFSWNDLTVIADFKGFINDTPRQRKSILTRYQAFYRKNTGLNLSMTHVKMFLL